MTDSTPAPEVLEEALHPELTDDSFVLNGRTVRIMPLKIKYQKQFAKAFTPIADAVAVALAANDQIIFTDAQGNTRYRAKTFQDFSPSDFVGIVSAFLSSVDVVPRLIQILAHNDGYAITDEELDDSTVPIEEMQAILLKAWRKGGKIQQEIADFFESAARKGSAEVLKLLSEAKSKIREGDSTTTA